LKTEERLAAEYGVSARTIRRDAEYAAAVDALVAECGPWAKPLLVSPGSKLAREDALRLVQMGPADQRAIMAAYREGRGELPWRIQGPERFLRVPTNTGGLVETLLSRLGRQRLAEIGQRIGEVLNGQLPGEEVDSCDT
jgi:hypothetical protein